ncbi:uncharacterized protein V2V93DRAFT_362701 [Kockiozyma suomiensis]|uniref:uncharacterized protein n=1 Tax=Kockiozyma suomiensis TaxID=1337062 RepID=UPI003343FA00
MLEHAISLCRSHEQQYTAPSPAIPILDIRTRTSSDACALRKNIIAGLRLPSPQIATEILYDTRGLQLYDSITHTPEYYLTASEIGILTSHAQDIAASVPDSAILLELGCGSLAKTQILLTALDRLGKKVSYYALDLSKAELERSISRIGNGLSHVSITGLLGTYDDARRWLAFQRQRRQSPVVAIWLGSSIGNFTRQQASQFLSSFASEALRPADSFVVGIDRRNEPAKVWKAYNDDLGATDAFIMNGLDHVNSIFDKKLFKKDEWKYSGIYHNEEGFHEAYYVAQRDVDLSSTVAIKFSKGDKIKIEHSYKYSSRETAQLFDQSGLIPIYCWTDKSETYDVHVVTVAPFHMTCTHESGVPNLSEWKTLWTAWDIVSESMMSPEMLTEQPIPVRNECIFYRGHIPTFLDIKLTQAISCLSPIEPLTFRDMFARGVDADLDDLSKVHWHSPKPSEWPANNIILRYKALVRQRLKALYNDLELVNSNQAWRALWLGFEHEAMHLETLLYMLVQSSKTCQPPVAMRLDSRAENTKYRSTKILDLSPTVAIGMDEIESAQDSRYGWDNERPKRQIITHSSSRIEVSRKLITNGEYWQFLRATNRELPASWSGSVDDPRVKSVYGPLSFKPQDQEGPASWPVLASYNEFSAYCEWKNDGWRLPTEIELLQIYDYASRGNADTNTYDVVMSNIGFKSWTPSTLSPECELSGVGSMGVFEWTSTVLEPHAGFQVDELYPEYTADFFDGKHNLVLGGSWATTPRQCVRRSFRNWYQRGYRYAFVGARMVRSLSL